MSASMLRFYRLRVFYSCYNWLTYPLSSRLPFTNSSANNRFSAYISSPMDSNPTLYSSTASWLYSPYFSLNYLLSDSRSEFSAFNRSTSASLFLRSASRSLKHCSNCCRLRYTPLIYYYSSLGISRFYFDMILATLIWFIVFSSNPSSLS